MEVNTGNFMDSLVWREGTNNKWYLDKRECQPVDPVADQNTDFIEFEVGTYDRKEDTIYQINAGDFVISEMGKLVVNKIEEGQAFLQLENDEVPVPLTSVKKVIKVNVALVGKTKVTMLKDVEISLSQTFADLKSLVSEMIELPLTSMTLHIKDSEGKHVAVESEIIKDKDIKENDTVVVTFKEPTEVCAKRSASKDYSWSDKKNFIPFSVDKKIIINAFGFFRNYENKDALYDLRIYEVCPSTHQKKLILMVNNIQVSTSDVDSLYVKKVDVTPFVAKPSHHYYAYVDFKLDDMRTYYSYCGTQNISEDGVGFKFLDNTEEGHRNSNSSGHLPYIYFKTCNPYID
jgi:hypothetical protein